MKKNNLFSKGMVLGIIILFLGASVIPGISGSKNFAIQLDQKQIGIEPATRVANLKLMQLEKSNGFSIKNSIEIYKDSEDTVLFYIFNLRPQGYIVVSANSDLPPVIAYSFTTDFQSDVSDDNMLLNILKADIQLRLENIPNLPNDIIESGNILWDTYLNEGNEKLANKDFQQWPPDGTTSTGGWLETNWHQNSPYNNFCPIDLSSGQRSVAGCPAVTMAQILNYHEATNNITFDDDDDYYHNYFGNYYWIDDDYELYDFPSFPELNNYLDVLESHYQNQTPLTDDDKASLTFACGVAAKQVYHPQGSGTFGVNQAYNAYLRFNCTTVELLDEDDDNLYGRLLMNMIDELPAHLAVVNPEWTMGHNLVVDGYNTDNYYHLNFGWGGSYNGWYLLPDDIPFGLTVVEGVILDILTSSQTPHCGNVNDDDVVNVGDVVYLINYLYRNGPEPEPLLCFGDATGDGTVDIGDVVYLINYLFRDGPEPEGCCGQRQG